MALQSTIGGRIPRENWGRAQSDFARASDNRSREWMEDGDVVYNPNPIDADGRINPWTAGAAGGPQNNVFAGRSEARFNNDLAMENYGRISEDLGFLQNEGLRNIRDQLAELRATLASASTPWDKKNKA